MDFENLIKDLSIPTLESIKILPNVQSSEYGWQLAYDLLNTEVL